MLTRNFHVYFLCDVMLTRNFHVYFLCDVMLTRNFHVYFLCDVMLTRNFHVYFLCDVMLTHCFSSTFFFITFQTNKSFVDEICFATSKGCVVNIFLNVSKQRECNYSISSNHPDGITFLLFRKIISRSKRLILSHFLRS